MEEVAVELYWILLQKLQVEPAVVVEVTEVAEYFLLRVAVAEQAYFLIVKKPQMIAAYK